MQLSLFKNMNFLTIEQIAELTGTTIKFIRRELACGNLPYIKKRNKKLVDEADYENWVKTADFSGNINKIKKKKDIVNWVDIEKEMKTVNGFKNNKQIRDFNFIDLFSGAGGLSCGLTMAGMMPVGSVEIIPQAVETYKYNFGRIKGFVENVTDRDIRDETVK